jgi:hypothetical protein
MCIIRLRCPGPAWRLIKSLCALRIVPVLVAEDILGIDPTVGSDLVVRNLPGFEKLDQKRPRHVEHVCGLLGGQLRADRNERHGFSPADEHEQFHDHPADWVRRGGSWKLDMA